MVSAWSAGVRRYTTCSSLRDTHVRIQLIVLKEEDVARRQDGHVVACPLELVLLPTNVHRCDH